MSWCRLFMWAFRCELCLNCQLQNRHWNCPCFPHSYLTCLNNVFLYWYAFPHCGQMNILLRWLLSSTLIESKQPVSSTQFPSSSWNIMSSPVMEDWNLDVITARSGSSVITEKSLFVRFASIYFLRSYINDSEVAIKTYQKIIKIKN